MKYLNHLNAIIAVVGVLIIGNTLLHTFWDQAPAKRPTIDLNAPGPSKSGMSGKTPLSAPQGRRPSTAAPASRAPLGQTRVPPQASPRTPSAVTPGTISEDSGRLGLSGSAAPSPVPATSGVLGQPGATGRVMENPEPLSLEEPAGARKTAPAPAAARRYNRRTYPQQSRPMFTQPEANRAAKRDQPQADPNANAPTPPPRSSMPQ